MPGDGRIQKSLSSFWPRGRCRSCLEWAQTWPSAKESKLTIPAGNDTVQDASKIISEIQILQQLRHEAIISLYHSWIASDQVYFITELMTSGTLKSYIRKTKVIKQKILRNWCRQILRGLVYLHSLSPPIIHRDLKCENIFINGNNGQVRWSFGNSIFS